MQVTVLTHELLKCQNMTVSSHFSETRQGVWTALGHLLFDGQVRHALELALAKHRWPRTFLLTLIPQK